jgi:hypothetical protein
MTFYVAFLYPAPFLLQTLNSGYYQMRFQLQFMPEITQKRSPNSAQSHAQPVPLFFPTHLGQPRVSSPGLPASPHGLSVGLQTAGWKTEKHQLEVDEWRATWLPTPEKKIL